MKSTTVLATISALCLASSAMASESHDLDRGLESSLRAAVHDRHVHVHVHNGIVDIDGRVQTEADRARIESLVRQTPGVVAVKDELHVILPSPGAAVSVPLAVPVYTAPAPVVVASTTIVSRPPPLIIPEYPRLTIQPGSGEDQSIAVRIARQLQVDGLPVSIVDNVTATVQGGIASVTGAVETQADHLALLTALERAGGVRAIYDQVRVRSM
jgi:hypothetical protein